LDLFVPYSPVVGVAELPQQPLEAMVSGTLADKPLLIGSVRDEGLIFAYEAFPDPESRVAEDAVMTTSFGAANAHRILKQYPRSAAGKSAKDMRNHTSLWATDGLFHCAIRYGALALAPNATNATNATNAPAGKRVSPVWVYHFDQVPTFGEQGWTPGFTECIPAVCHSAELPYLFRTEAYIASLNASFSPRERTLGESMETFWANFARDGEPGTDAINDVTWPPFDATEEASMRFKVDGSAVSTVVNAAQRDKCQFWDQLGYEWHG